MYIQRDRLQSGLSEIVLVVHCEEDSGSIKTAEFARKQGVKVLRYQETEKSEGDLLPFAKTLTDPEAFRSFLKKFKPGEAIVYEQMKLPFL